MDHAAKFLKDAKSRDQAARDLLWSVVNSLEFIQLYDLEARPAAAREFSRKVAEVMDKK